MLFDYLSIYFLASGRRYTKKIYLLNTRINVYKKQFYHKSRLLVATVYRRYIHTCIFKPLYRKPMAWHTYISQSEVTKHSISRQVYVNRYLPIPYRLPGCHSSISDYGKSTERRHNQPDAFHSAVSDERQVRCHFRVLVLKQCFYRCSSFTILCIVLKKIKVK